MQKIRVFLTIALAVVIILTAACGQRQQKTGNSENVEASLEETDTPQPMTDDQFNELLKEIVYKLPATVMPEYLKSEQQRRQSKFESYRMNCFSHNKEFGEGSFEVWEINGFLTEDNQNVVLFVDYYACLDGCNTILDKTLNYNIKTQHCNEIERPMQMPTVDEMVVREHFESQQLYEKAKEYFAQNPKFSCSCSTDEITVTLDFLEFNMHFDYEIDIYSASYTKNKMMILYKWNGVKFEKYKVTEQKI